MISNNTYEEVYQVLKQMDKMSVMKIPEDILNNIIKNRNSGFKTNIKKNDIFNQANISKDAIDVLCCISYNYWLNSSEKEEIDKINIEIEKEKINKYNPDNIFDKNDKKVSQEKFDLIEYKEETIFDKIKNFLRKLLFKIKK